MNFDPDNKIVKLCIYGMDLEGEGKMQDASEIFIKAWNDSVTDIEKFISAHYVARHQESITDKLKWDEIALKFALEIDKDFVKGAFPSLYLNIAKCYEDLNNMEKQEKTTGRLFIILTICKMMDTEILLKIVY